MINEPGLAQLEIPRREMGRKSVEILLELLRPAASAPVRVTLPCGLDEGQTMGPPRRGLASAG